MEHAYHYDDDLLRNPHFIRQLDQLGPQRQIDTFRKILHRTVMAVSPLLEQYRAFRGYAPLLEQLLDWLNAQPSWFHAQIWSYEETARQIACLTEATDELVEKGPRQAVRRFILRINRSPTWCGIPGMIPIRWRHPKKRGEDDFWKHLACGIWEKMAECADHGVDGQKFYEKAEHYFADRTSGWMTAPVLQAILAEIQLDVRDRPPQAADDQRQLDSQDELNSQSEVQPGAQDKLSAQSEVQPGAQDQMQCGAADESDFGADGENIDQVRKLDCVH